MIPSPIFILGTQRSGTTLLTRVLSAHPKIFIKNEIEVNETFIPSGSKNDILSRIDLQIAKSHGFDDIKDLLEKKGKEIWGVKDPQFTEHVNSLKHFLPESKFIIIIRDGRGVVNSYIDNKWGLATNAYTGALRWVKEVQIQKEFMKLKPENFLLIRFEDFISNMESALIEICDHIGVEFNASMLNYNSSNANFKINKQNINTNKSPDRNIAEKWMVELSEQEINVIEHVAGEELVTNGYDLVGKPIKLSVFKVFYYKLQQLILGEIQLQYQLKKYKIKLLMKKARHQVS